MMFTENYIFQSIMLTMAQATFICNKYPQSCWILMKMIETSPFIFNNIHLQACLLLDNCLSQIDISNNLPFRQIDKYKKKVNKMFMRIKIKLLNKEKIINLDSNSNNLISIPSNKNSLNISLENIWNYNKLKKMSSKDLFTNTISKNSLNKISRNRSKNITLCISEKLLEEINGEELKDIIFKFYKKFF